MRGFEDLWAHVFVGLIAGQILNRLIYIHHAFLRRREIVTLQGFECAEHGGCLGAEDLGKPGVLLCLLLLRHIMMLIYYLLQ